MEQRIYVNIAQRRTAPAPAVFICSALGSCVAVCLYDALRHVGGVVHILLPSASLSLKNSNPDKFADCGVANLVRDLTALGAERRKMRAKIAGGACLFNFAPRGAELAGSLAAIGERNVVMVKQELRKLAIPIMAEDTGDKYGRSVRFSAEDGELVVKSVKYGIKVL